MYSKRIIAIMAVAFLIACPVAVACTSVDADSNGADEKAALITIKNVKDYNSIKDYFVLGNNEEIASVFGLSSINTEVMVLGAKTIKDVSVVTGAKSVKDGDTSKTEMLKKYTYTFEIPATIIGNGKIGTLENSDYASGDGVTAIKEIIGGDYTKGQEITLKGKYTIGLVSYSGGDMYHNNSLGYTPKNSTVYTITDIVTEGTFSVKNGKTIEIKSTGKSNIEQSMQFKYDKAWKDVTKDYKGTAKVGKIDFKKLDATYDVKVGNDKKDVKIDSNKLKEYTKKQLTSSTKITNYAEEGNHSWTAKFTSSIDAKVEPSSIPCLTEKYQSKTMTDVENEAKRLGGTCSYKVEDYNKVSNDIKNSVGTNSSSSDNKWIWIAVAIVVILIIAAIAIWYFKFRTPPAE